MDEDIDQELVEYVKKNFYEILDSIIEEGTEYKEIYEKQSDFAKICFFSVVSHSISKEELETIFASATAMEENINKMHGEPN